jgi:hypothetical protein
MNVYFEFEAKVKRMNKKTSKFKEEIILEIRVLDL